jgi:lysophospholipase L1-like esterase
MRIKIRLIQILLTLLLAIILSKAALYSLHTLGNQSRWVLGKSLLDDSINGINGATWQRQLLARNRLNLGVWLGHQEVLHAEPILLKSLSVRIRLSPQGYIDLILGRDTSSTRAVRLSASSDVRSRYFVSDSTGYFTESIELPEFEIAANTWINVGIEYTDSSLLRISADRFVAELPNKVVEEGLIGFRGSAVAAEVDTLVVESADEQGSFRENFENSEVFLKVLGRIFLIGILVLLFFEGIGRVLIGSNTAQGAAFATFYLVCVSFTYYGFDFYYYSSLYPTGRLSFVGGQEDKTDYFEKYRARIVTYALRAVGIHIGTGKYVQARRRVAEYLEVADTQNGLLGESTQVCRSDRPYEKLGASFVSDQNLSSGNTQFDVLVLLGTSQAHGSGALRRKERLSRQLCAMLGASNNVRRPWLVINLARRGANSQQQLDAYRRDVSHLGSHTLVVNLANNDSDPSTFQQAIYEITSIATATNGRVILIEEPVERFRPGLRKKYQALARVADTLDLTLLRPSVIFSDTTTKNSGHLWWDTVHLTSYGQSILARQIVNELLGVTVQ